MIMDCNDNNKIIGVIHVPSKKTYMCLSIRRYYISKEFMRLGATKEQAKELANKTIS